MVGQTATRSIVAGLLRFCLISASTGVMLALAGCYTPPEDHESQMPWSTPQDWESSPMMPGLGER
jgi:hypothetical protein